MLDTNNDVIPTTYKEYTCEWGSSDEILILYGTYSNVNNTINEPISIFKVHNSPNNRVIFDDGAVMIYANQDATNSVFIVRGENALSTIRIRILGKAIS